MKLNNFKKWMELNTDLAEKTIRNYSWAISKINNYLVDNNVIQFSLEVIVDPDELDKIKHSYFLDPQNAELDKRGNGIYSAGFSKFITYKQSQGGKPVGNEGIVYILSNPAIPGLVKIGKTNNIEARLKSLFTSGLPVPFRCVLAKKVADYSEVENKLHNGLKSVRENENREFFRIAEDEVINLLELVDGVDVTPEKDQFDDKEDEVAFAKATRVGQKFNFELVDISPGAILNFSKDENVTCKVVSKTRIEFEGEEHSLSSAALKQLQKMGYKWKSAAGPLNWKYEGELLDARRRRFEEG